MSQEIAKAGWMFRRSTILKKWKKNWFVLCRDGTFKFYENSSSNSAEDTVSMNTECSDVLSEIKNVVAPQYLDESCLLSVVKMNGDTWTLCAESADDKKTWEFVLNDARLLPLPPPSYNIVHPHQQHHHPYQTPVYGQDPTNPQRFYGQYPTQQQQYPTQQQYYTQQYPPNTVVVYPNQYQRNNGLGTTTGLLAGAAVGSLLLGPVFWW